MRLSDFIPTQARRELLEQKSATEKQMDLSIMMVLAKYKCPFDLYPRVWIFIPHNDKPDITLLKNYILKRRTSISGGVGSLLVADDVEARLAFFRSTFADDVHIVNGRVRIVGSEAKLAYFQHQHPTVTGASIIDGQIRLW